MARDAAALVEGRSIPVQRSGASGRETVRARVDGADGEGGLFEVISTALSNACTGQSSARFASFDAQAVTNASLTADAIRAQTDELCRGYFFLGLAEAVAPTELVPGPTTDETRFVVRRPGDGIDSAASILTIPILTGSDAATAALVAVSHFQAAALAGRELLVDQNIAPEVFGTTLPSGDDERVTLAFVLVTQTVEAAQLIETASEVATGQIAGAAQARLASDSDHVRARIESWRARHDSRLEMAAVLGGVPEALFEPEPTSTADAALVSSEERLPAISWMPSRDSERRAVDLLRASRVDPRTGGEMTVARRLRLVMQRDYPDSMPVVTDDADFLRRIGVTDSEQALAANFLRSSSEVGTRFG